MSSEVSRTAASSSRHAAQAARCCSTPRASPAERSSSTNRSSVSGSGWMALFMSSLLQPGDGAGEEFAHGGDADPQRLGDFPVLQPFGAEMEALPLLGRERFPCVSDLLHP